MQMIKNQIYWRGFAAYHIYMALPFLDRLPGWTYFWLVPSAGDYAEWKASINRQQI